MLSLYAISKAFIVCCWLRQLTVPVMGLVKAELGEWLEISADVRRRGGRNQLICRRRDVHSADSTSRHRSRNVHPRCWRDPKVLVVADGKAENKIEAQAEESSAFLAGEHDEENSIEGCVEEGKCGIWWQAL